MDRETPYRLSTRSIKTSRRERNTFLQSNFKADLKKKMGSNHTNPYIRDVLWCPVMKTYLDRDSMIAGHLFPWKCGEDSMKAIFGGSDSGQSEMFTAENGILWSKRAEERFEAGLFVIVPDIVDQPTKQQVETWEASDPKEYKIRVLNSKHAWMKGCIHDTTKTWAELDHERLEFRTNFRPRARYFYFRYCAAMLRHSFGGHHLQISKAELRKRFWVAPGRYMREGMLLGFVEEMGHEYEHLLEGAIKENEAVADPTALAVAYSHIQRTLRSADEEESDSDTDDDGDDDSDDNGNEEFAYFWGFCG